MKQCNSCLQWKEEEEFNYRYKALEVRHPTCKTCQKVFRKNWYESHKEEHQDNVHARKRRLRDEAREWVYQYLLTHPCESCGESDPRVLEFHHLSHKDRAVSELIAGGYPIARISSELSHCQVLCANCHSKLTMEERGWFRGRK
jgi:hypothetical protein